MKTRSRQKLSIILLALFSGILLAECKKSENPSPIIAPVPPPYGIYVFDESSHSAISGVTIYVYYTDQLYNAIPDDSVITDSHGFAELQEYNPTRLWHQSNDYYMSSPIDPSVKDTMYLIRKGWVRFIVHDDSVITQQYEDKLWLALESDVMIDPGPFQIPYVDYYGTYCLNMPVGDTAFVELVASDKIMHASYSFQGGCIPPTTTGGFDFATITTHWRDTTTINFNY